MRLVLVELRRFRSRRAIAGVLVVAFLVTGVIAATTLWERQPVGAAELARAQALAERERQRPYVQRDLANCKEDPAQFLGPGAEASTCSEALLPRAEWFLDHPPLRLEEVGAEAGLAVIMLLTAAAVLVGVTFIGADWASGSVSNQLLFQPSRSRTWWAKGAAVVVGSAAVAAVALGVFWAALVFFHARWDAPAVPPGFWSDNAWAQARGLGLLGAGALGGYALTVLLRHTGAALGLVMGYALVGETVLRALELGGIQKWLLTNHVLAWLFDGYEVLLRPEGCRDVYTCGVGHTITMADSGLYLGLLLAAVVAVSWLAFGRRDVP